MGNRCYNELAGKRKEGRAGGERERTWRKGAAGTRRSGRGGVPCWGVARSSKHQATHHEANTIKQRLTTFNSRSQRLYSCPHRRRRQRILPLERALGALEPHATSGGARRVPLPEHPVRASPIQLPRLHTSLAESNP